jgi:hypothetical protein
MQRGRKFKSIRSRERNNGEGGVFFTPVRQDVTLPRAQSRSTIQGVRFPSRDATGEERLEGGVPLCFRSSSPPFSDRTGVLPLVLTAAKDTA